MTNANSKVINQIDGMIDMISTKGYRIISALEKENLSNHKNYSPVLRNKDE